jgi:uncharacterized protein YdgA (DUF945 family)
VKKGWIVAIVVIAALYPASAWLLGYSIEHRTDEFVQRFNESNPYVKISANRFHRGWFTSDQALTLEAARPAFGAGSMRLTVHNIIHHGPICGTNCIGLAQIDSHLVFSPELQPYVTSVFGSAEPLSIRSRLGLLGGGSAQISSPAIGDAVFADGHLSSEGLNARSEYATNLDSYSIQASAPHLVYAAKDGKRFDVLGISTDIQSKRALRTLYTGDTSIAIGQLSFGNAAASSTFSASDFKITSHAAIADGFMTAAVKYGVAGVTAPPVTLTGVNFDLTFRHLEAESLERLTAALREINRDTTMAPQARLGKMMDAAKPHAIALFAKQPELSIDRISASTAAGSALMSGLIKFRGLAAEDFDSAAGMKGLINKIDADVDASIDEAFLTSLPGGAASTARLQPLVSQGLATLDGDKFRTKIGFHGGQATFNGRPFGPPIADKK